jgi:hypothetical protein
MSNINSPVTKPIRLLILLGLSLLTLQGFGQFNNHLVVRKNGFRDKLNFLAGDPIVFIRDGNNYAEEYYLQGIGTDFIIANGQEIPLKKIDCVIHHRTGFNFRSSGGALLVAAPAYLLIGAVNNLFQKISPVPTVTNLVVAGSLATAGLLLPRLQVKKYHLGRKYSLIIVQSDPMLNK